MSFTTIAAHHFNSKYQLHVGTLGAFMAVLID